MSSFLDKFQGCVRVLNCKHGFHKKCLKPWIKHNLEQKKMPECPVCRQNIYTDEDFQKKINKLESGYSRYNNNVIENITYYYSDSDSDYSQYEY